VDDVNPDRRRSSSGLYLVERGRDLFWLMVVRGHGVLTMRAEGDTDTGRLKFKGVALFTKEEIGYAPALDGGGV
jgi:hypothetical protein